jgi:hypothetical protein
MNKSKEDVVVGNKDVHGWNKQASVVIPHIANNPFPADNSRVSPSLVNAEGDKKSDEVLLAITKGIQSKEEFRVKFSVSDSGAYQYYGCVIALRNGQEPLIKSNEVLVDMLREVSTEVQLVKVTGISEKLGADYWNHIVGLRGEN